MISAAAAIDPSGLEIAPAALLVEADQGRLKTLAIGRPDEVAQHPAAKAARRSDFPRAVILPGLVNAHTHLDLTHLGPMPLEPGASFATWAKSIASGRLTDASAVRESVQEGIRLSTAGGVVAVGDIAGDWRTEPVEELQGSGLLGVSFLEIFGMAGREDASAQRLTSLLTQRSDLVTSQRVKLGIQPHAPYSVGSKLYHEAARLASQYGLPLATHVAESPDERQLLDQGDGPLRELLEEMGLWSAEVALALGIKGSPVRRVLDAVGEAPLLAVHVCDCSDDDIDALARAGTSVAYCPRASDYFRYQDAFGAHRYRDMLDAGINVCLGTDSIVCLPENDSNRISTLDEMRFLYQRDGADPLTLLQMATTNGARALGIDPDLFTLQAGQAVGGLIAIEVDSDDLREGAMVAVLRATRLPEVVAE